MAFFGVYVPPKFEPSAVAAAASSNPDCDKNLLVFTKREEAFKVLKTHSDARVKGFASRDEANRFAQFGQDQILQTNSSNDPSKVQLRSPSSSLNPEKTAFRGPKLQELVEFRKAIESGNLTVVHAKITENPRFLIGSGDTPSILKEGQRYNAMHVAALAKNAKMCELILGTLRPSYVQRFHGGKQSPEVSEEVAAKLLDLYLNTPEKGRFETPLHLAVKYGAVEVVEVLTSFPQCKMLPNKEEQMPRDIICFRAPSLDQDIKDRIAQLLEERFYVPVLRSVDSTIPAVVGEPFSSRCPPASLNGSGNALTPELQVRAYAGPMDQEQADSFRKRWRTPPAAFSRSADRSHLNLTGNSSYSLLSQSLGALNTSSENVLLMRSPIRSQPRDAKRPFHRLILGSPQRSGSPRTESLVSTPKGKSGSALRSIDEFFGVEKKGEEEQRPEPEIYCSNESLNRIRPSGELSSAKKSLFGGQSPKSPMPRNVMICDDNDLDLDSELDASYRERHMKLTDTEKGLEVIGRILAKERNVGWTEYWPFLDNFANFTTTAGMQQLEQHLKTRAEDAKRQSKRNSLDSKTSSAPEETVSKAKGANNLNISDICDRLNELHLNNNNNGLQRNGLAMVDSSTVPAPLNSLLCVERSLQVYAKRATKKILGTSSSGGEDVIALNGSLSAELGRLESLVCSYKEDHRFREVAFQVTHSRFAHLVLTYLLEDEPRYRGLWPTMKRSLAAIRSCSEGGGERDRGVTAEQLLKEMRISAEDVPAISATSHVKCLANYLLVYAEDEGEKVMRDRNGGLRKLVAEEDCQRVWSDESKCACLWVAGKRQGAMSSVSGVGGHNNRMRDKNKKKRINDRIKRQIELAATAVTASNNELLLDTEESGKASIWEHRSKGRSGDNEEDVLWADSNDSDHSLDSTDSEECFFYTPVESPTEFLTASDRSEEEESDEAEEEEDGLMRRVKGGKRGKGKGQKRGGFDLSTYRNYVLGDEPTKTDMDVYNAICDVKVEEATLPHVFKWQQAINLHSLEEIQNFPSLSMIVRKSIPIGRVSVDKGSPFSGRRLFGMSPMK